MGEAGSYEVAGKGHIFTKTNHMVSIGAIFISTYHTKQLNPWPNSSASRVVNYSQLSASKGDMQPLEGDPRTHGCLTSLRNKPCTAKQQNGLGNFQHQYLPELLVNACVQLLFVSCYCVRGSRLFSNLVTIMNGPLSVNQNI